MTDLVYVTQSLTWAICGLLLGLIGGHLVLLIWMDD
jgi:hypothetical protein